MTAPSSRVKPLVRLTFAANVTVDEQCGVADRPQQATAYPACGHPQHVAVPIDFGTKADQQPNSDPPRHNFGLPLHPARGPGCFPQWSFRLHGMSLGNGLRCDQQAQGISNDQQGGAGVRHDGQPQAGVPHQGK